MVHYMNMSMLNNRIYFSVLLKQTYDTRNKYYIFS